MTGNNISEKAVNVLLQYSFFIPSYQRGYRWTKRQVEDLLRDIDEFTPKEIKDSLDKTWYCLQPLVVKKGDAKIKEEFKLNSNSDWYEVIDGQQRLTTIFLIVHYINEMRKGKPKLNEISLKYQTRDKSEKFLVQLQIDENTDNVNINEDNIDFYHISLAYRTIHGWLKSKENFHTGNFESKFVHSTKVIWYETSATDSISIFTRINMGKIPLTNAELIKALFLNSSNFINSDKDKIRLKQLEIASEWDRIEYALKDDAFWYFLNKDSNPLATRIEFIFNLMAEKPENTDEYSTFTYFNEKFKDKTEKVITDNWQEIKRYYQSLEEWFSDRELYHKIGFLIATGTEIKELLQLKNEKSKTMFREALDALINKKVKVQINALEYGLEYGNESVRKILLLHNIQTLLNNKIETNRFPFDRYKKEKWDVEHITAVAEEMPQTEKHQKEWLTEVSNSITDDLLKEKINKYNKEEFEQLHNEILNHFSESKKHEDINDISNLVLLDATTNRSYKNFPFQVKRNTIIKREKKGTFIPVCTKNVFMKAYSSDVSQMTLWKRNDGDAYVKDILETLNHYLPEQIQIGNEQ